MKSLLSLVIILCAGSLAAQPGTLDSSFGVNGQVYNDFGNDYGRCNAAALQKDGRIVCVGSGNILTDIPPIWGFLVVRYLSNGMPDESFGRNGRVVTSFANGGGYANAVAIQPDGKIVAVGYGGFDTSNTGTDFFVVRYNPDGSLDENFGDNGLVTTDYGLAQEEYANAVVIQPDGKLVVTGDYAGQYFLTVRYNADGSLDKSFGDGGKVKAPWGGLSLAWAAALQPDGKILTAGNYSSHYAVIARYLPDGMPDSSFGDNGVVYNYKGYIYNTICLQADGKILTGGQTENGVTGDMLLVRYNSNGKPDSSFGANSSVKFVFSQPVSFIRTTSLYGKDKIMIAGTVGNAFNPKWNEVAVSLLYINDGTLDTSFGEEGFATFSSNGLSTSTGLVTKNGDIIIQALSATYDGVYIFRFNGYAQQQTPITHIKRWLHKHGITWDDCPPSICNKITGYTIQRSKNNINWKTVYSSKANLNSYIDPSPLPGTNYYRLQITGTEGVVVYSNVIAINNEESIISLSPNPARNVLHIEGLPSAAKTKITVVDLAGNVACSVQLGTNSSSYNLTVDKLKPGNYLLRIESESSVVTKQFVKE